MSTSTPSSPPRSDSTDSERIDVRRYIEAVRRSAALIAAVMVVITGGVIALSLLMPKTYEATTRVVLEEDAAAIDGDAESIERQLATTEQLLTTRRILDDAAQRVPGVDADEIAGRVTSSVDPEANIINVVVEGRDPSETADIANAVADAFLEQRAEIERERIGRAREDLVQEIARLEGDLNAEAQIAAIRERINELSVAAASAGADLQIADRARTPSSPKSPRPFRNGVLALFASIFLGVLLALARDQFVPRVSGTRELSRILDLPVLIGVPYVRRAFPRRRSRVLSGVEDEAYQTLRASLEFALPPGEQRVILMTGALHGEGKTTATSRLGRAMARVGHRTLLVSADLRVPKLHDYFGLSTGVGLSDLLAVLDWEGHDRIEPELLERSINFVPSRARGKRQTGHLHVMTSGTKTSDPAPLVSGPAMQAFIDNVRDLEYDYVLIDAPPLLGLPDAQVMSRWVDATILVSRLDRMTLEQASELREVLDRLEHAPLGLIVIGVTAEISPYYMRRAPNHQLG